MCALFEPHKSSLKKVSRRSERGLATAPVSELAPEERVAYGIGSSLHSRGLFDSHASLQNLGGTRRLRRIGICSEQWRVAQV